MAVGGIKHSKRFLVTAAELHYEILQFTEPPTSTVIYRRLVVGTLIFIKSIFSVLKIHNFFHYDLKSFTGRFT